MATKKARKIKKNPDINWLLIAGGLVATALVLVPMFLKKGEEERRSLLRTRTSKAGSRVAGFVG